MARQEVLARNLANSTTAGYKEEFAPIDGFSANINRSQRAEWLGFARWDTGRPHIGSMGTGVGISRVAVNFRQGIIQQTHRPLDVALAGDGFLEVRTVEGDYFFRGGALHVDANRRLVTDEGFFVLDSQGEVITLGEGEIAIDRDGTISVDGETVAQLSVVEFEPGTMLAKVGSTLYTIDDPDTAQPMAAQDTEVRQGYLESSNVDEISTMTELASGLRAYQASQRMLLAQDELLGKAVNEVGRV
jgi:flagellar basal-body rod protein FlgF